MYYNKISSSTFMCLVLLLLMVPNAMGNANDNYTPAYNPTLEVRMTVEEIKIDGSLNDPGWQNAARAGNFAEHRPGDQTKPPVETEAYITYDQDNLYVAFICYDDPQLIRASLSERENLHADDNICLLIDTYSDASWAYELNVNPYGIQADAIWSRAGGEDGSYDMIWKSAGKITDKGYQIEMAVPFASLRFPNQQKQSWKIDFWRNHPREIRRQYSWAAYDRDDPCWPCQWGTVTGIENVQPGKGIEILPSLIAYQTGQMNGNGTIQSPFDFDNQDPDAELSIGVKYSIASNIIAEGTYNPDFSQIEADAAQVDVNTTFALYYPERRPFFQEGSDLFHTWTNLVYTRSINDPQFAGKVTGRLGRTNLAYLVAYDENSPIIVPFFEGSADLLTGESVSNLFRLKQILAEDTHVGLLVTDRRFDNGGSGTVIDGDAEIRFTKNFRLQTQIIATYTDEDKDDDLNSQVQWYIDNKYIESTFDDSNYTSYYDGESYWGSSIIANLEERSRHFDFDISYWQFTPTYRLHNGYQSNNDMRQGELYTAYTFFFDDGFFETIKPFTRSGIRWDFDGEKIEEWATLEADFQMKGQTNVHPRFKYGSEKFHGIEFDNVWMLHNCCHSQFSELLGGSFYVNYGNQIAYREDPPVLGRSLSVGAYFELKPLDRMRFEMDIDYQRSEDNETGDELYEGYLLWSKLSFQFTKELSLRLVTQYNDFRDTWDIDPLLTYRLNAFSMLYLGSTYCYRDYQVPFSGGFQKSTRLSSRQFFMKMQYLFQV